MMTMMTTPLSDLVKTRRGQSASTSSFLGDDCLQLSCVKTDWDIVSPYIIPEGDLEVHVDDKALEAFWKIIRASEGLLK